MNKMVPIGIGITAIGLMIWFQVPLWILIVGILLILAVVFGIDF